jgi:hypothetical protein
MRVGLAVPALVAVRAAGSMPAWGGGRNQTIIAGPADYIPRFAQPHSSTSRAPAAGGVKPSGQWVRRS